MTSTTESPARASEVGRAYDALAPDYDEHLHGARWMRRLLWARFHALFPPGSRVIDVGCGTGLDTLHLASRGVHVTAVDASGGMIERLRAKVVEARLDARVETHVGDAVSVLSSLTPHYDGVVSSFAALNTVDLVALASETERLVRPGGSFTAHMLTPTYWRPLRTRLVAPFVTAHDEAEHVVDLRGQGVPHRVARRGEVYDRHFRRGFLLRKSLWLDGVMAAVSAGRFFVLDLARRGPAPGSSS